MIYEPSRKARDLVLGVTLVLAISGCAEVTSNEYTDRNDALAKGAIGESKWLPTWLPDDAVDIRETHDVDTNESWLVFRPGSGELNLSLHCQQASQPEISGKRVMLRFPKFAQDAWSRASHHTGEFYRCPDGFADRWAIYDEELNLVYSWVKF